MDHRESPCQLCGQTGLTEFEIKGSSRLWLCESCELYQYGEVVDQSAYEAEYHAGYEKHRSKKIRTARIRLNRLEPLLDRQTQDQAPRILDVGCSVGATLSAAQLLKWDAVGVDVSQDAVDYCQSLGLNSRKVSGGELPFEDNTFDAVVNWHVVEHVENVRETLADWRRVLKPGGVLCMETPDGSSPKVRKLGTAYRKFWAPEHTYTFNYENLAQFLRETGFDVISGPWIGNVANHGPLFGSYAVAYRLFHEVRKAAGVHKEFQIFARKNAVAESEIETRWVPCAA